MSAIAAGTDSQSLTELKRPKGPFGRLAQGSASVIDGMVDPLKLKNLPQTLGLVAGGMMGG